MATDEKYSVSPDLLAGILADLGVRSIGELMEKSEEEQEATKKRLIAYDPIAFESLTRRSTPYNLVDMGYVEAASRIKDWLESQSTVDAAEVVHGRWIKNWCNNSFIGHEYAECSICDCHMLDTNQFWNSNYCPNCGAKMDGGNGDG